MGKIKTKQSEKVHHTRGAFGLWTDLAVALPRRDLAIDFVDLMARSWASSYSCPSPLSRRLVFPLPFPFFRDFGLLSAAANSIRSGHHFSFYLLNSF